MKAVNESNYLLERIEAMLDEKLDKRLDEKFQNIDKRFDKMDERLDKMDERLDKMDERLDKMDERFDKMDERFEKMDSRMGSLEQQFIELRDTVDKHYGATLEFYGTQKEFNTYLSEQLREIQARQIIFENQTVKNTAMLTLVK